MPKTIEFFFDFVSPASLFAWHVIPKITEKAGAELVYRPMFLGGVMQATGNRPPAMVPAKGAWMGPDLARWGIKWGVSMSPNPHFPVNTLPTMRGACALLDDPIFRAYGDAMFKAVWQDAKNMAEPEEIATVVGELGLDPAAFAEMVQKQEWKDALKANTAEAVERGTFGAPTFFIGDEMFFGQDRMFMVAEELGIHITDVFPNY